MVYAVKSILTLLAALVLGAGSTFAQDYRWAGGDRDSGPLGGTSPTIPIRIEQGPSAYQGSR
jgi:hypothetical protein